MTAIVRAGAAGAGTEMGLAKQGFEGTGKSFVVEGLSTQSVFCFDGAEGRRTAGADDDANIVDNIPFAFEPDRAIQDGKRHALRTHDAFEAGRLMVIGNW